MEISIAISIAIFIVGITIGLVVAAVYGRSSSQARAQREAELKERVTELDGMLADHRDRLNRAEVKTGEAEARLQERESAHQEALEAQERRHREAVEAQEKRHAEALEAQEKREKEALEAQDTRHKESLDALRRQFEETVNTMSERLGNVTDEMLKQRQKEFSASSKEGLEQLLGPLNTSIKEMKETVQANTTRQNELGGRLDAGLTSLFQHTVAAQMSAEKLANALKGSNKVQGEWGETVLRELLESQGLKEGIHFETQSQLKDADGRAMVNEAGNKMRPDIVLHLDKTRDVVIDSKVSLTSYLEYVNAEDEGLRKAALDAHIRSIESHVAELAGKDYSAYFAKGKTPLGYVIMFVPNTGALLLATGTRPDLWRKAMERRVYIADEQTLYAALKIVNMTWQQIVQTSNHEKVYALASEMLDRVAVFMQKYSDIGSKIESLGKSYKEGMAKLKEGGQSIPGTCRKLVALGAKPRKTDLKGVAPEMLGLEGDQN
ncbi:MAG: DNA recombination protein RmuC [Muribaculaceae bacterium]|nr:DNA recombination protein RmuC [Muribaculaceae bacterium]